MLDHGGDFMRMVVSATALAAALVLAGAAHAGSVSNPQPPVGDPGDPGDPGNDPGDPGAGGGGTGGGSGGSAFAAFPAGPAGSTTYTTVFNGEQQGGFAGQPTSISELGQVFQSSGTLNQITFVDSNSTAGGEQLVIQAFDPNTFAATGPALYTSGVGALTGFGDGTGTGGADAYYQHTYAGIDLVLDPNSQYYAYLTPTAGSQVFNGSTSKIQSGAYFFLLGTVASPLGGEYVWEQGGTYYQIAGNQYHPDAYQALFAISITPAADVAGVPEPGTWATMLTGFGLAGAALRRRASGRMTQAI